MSIIELKEQIESQLNTRKINELEIDRLNRLIASSNGDDDTLVSILPSINSFLNDEKYYELDENLKVISLYETILSKLPINIISALYPLQVITTNLAYKNQFCLLILKLLTLNYDKIDMVDNGLLFEILKMYLADDELKIEICNQIERLFERTINIVNSNVLKEFQSLFAEVESNNNSTLVARLLTLILIKPSIYPYHFKVDPNDDDVLLNILKIQFFTDLIGKVDINTLPIDQMIELFYLRMENDIVDSFLITEVNNFLIKLSFKMNEFIFLKSSDFYLDRPSDVYLLSKFNASTFPPEFIKWLLEFPLSSNKYFTILLNLVKSKKCFDLLKFQLPDTIKTLSSNDHIYQLLVNLSLSSFGIDFLINSPSIMNDYVVSETPVYNEVFTLKLSLLDNLLKCPDLSIWEDKIIDVYKLMNNGRNIRSQPQVDVMDQAA
ncbi:DNA mismatch repair protein Hsm3p [[Candida] jaroonii]|uniref:DNA mismatch repair protein Hsm3p n=1 Tax=[Candida] jaroonii TaxID=467808 RepID=A0ACA9Y692_9ASCO|nr:DNA mismatch repair protein Hsm3p [[Candida] jaroonii]